MTSAKHHPQQIPPSPRKRPSALPELSSLGTPGSRVLVGAASHHGTRLRRFSSAEPHHGVALRGFRRYRHDMDS